MYYHISSQTESDIFSILSQTLISSNMSYAKGLQVEKSVKTTMNN